MTRESVDTERLPIDSSGGAYPDYVGAILLSMPTRTTPYPEFASRA
jgi:hypothetical protein